EIKPQYKKGANVSITIVPDDNYVLPNKDNITVQGVDDYTYDIGDKNATFTCVMPGNNVEVIVNAFDPREAKDYLSFTCNSTDGGTLSYVGIADETVIYDVNLEYSLNRENWTKVASLVEPYEPVEIHKFSKDETIYLRGNNPSGMALNRKVYTSFVTSEGSDFAVGGDIMSLLYNDDFAFEDTPPVDDCFDYLFSKCDISDASELILPGSPSKYCYRGLFMKCKNLTSAPALNATELAEGCCISMFESTGLVTIPTDYFASYENIPYGCFATMFYECFSLIQAPDLPATVLAEGCYNGMFYNCTSLTEAPELPAKTLAKDCYSSMFSKCTSLTTAPVLSATTLAVRCCKYMFEYCTLLKISEGSGGTLFFTCPDTSPEDCVGYMFVGTGGTFTGNPTAGKAYYWN
ncbi:MAG: hypothetical protein MJ207_03710, partial [Bacilli bacterium]|nr:hypothetical protein [Bacilli bacterium]